MDEGTEEETMKRRYYGGISAQNAAVIRKLQADTFPELVARYYDQAIPLSMTREEFHAKTQENQKRIKSVAYVTACSFTDLEAGRNDANADYLQLACFDFDEGEAVRQIFDAPQVVADQLGDVNFLLHTTATHTERKPRLRLVVDIDEMPLEMHRHVVLHIATTLGITDGRWLKGRRESMVLSQPMYRPVAFLGDTGSPVLMSRTNGRALRQDEIKLTEQEKENAQRRFSATFDGEEESLEYLPLNDIKVSDIAPALKAIDPDCDYETWCHVASALRHQFRDEEEAEEAFQLYDSWSSDALWRYPDGGTDDVFAKWKSFRPIPIGRPPITIRTLFRYAIDCGWDGSKMAAKTVAAFEKWLAEVETAAALLAEFAKRIAALPFPSEVQTATCCDKVSKRYQKLTGSKISAAKFLSQLKNDTDQKVLENPDDKPAWLRSIVYVASENAFCSTTTMNMFKPEAFDRYYGVQLMPDEIEAGGNARPVAMPGDYALNAMKIPRVLAKVYDPRYAGTEPIFVRNEQMYLNTYQPSYPDPDSSTSKEAGTILKTHLGKLILEPEYQRVFLDFLAFIVQHPGVKIRWTILVQSAEGAGKGMVAKAMEAVLGHGNVKPVSNTILCSQWNDWAVGCQLIIIEEIHVAGQNRKHIMDAMKELITNDDLPVNQRNTTARREDNLVNLLCFTNEHQALSLNSASRRYCIIKSPIQTREQAEELQTSGHIMQLSRLQKDLAPGLRHFLLHHQISDDFNPNGNAPITCYQNEMVEDSENPVIAAIRDLMDSDNPFVTKDCVAVCGITDHLGKEFWHSKPSKFLREMGFVVAARRVRIGEKSTDVWRHRDFKGDAVATLRDLVAKQDQEPIQ